MPSSALAIASSRRATRASDFLLASLRSTTGDRSLRIHSAVILPSSNQSEGNHEPDPLGIAPRQQESSLSTPGISRISRFREVTLIYGVNIHYGAERRRSSV